MMLLWAWRQDLAVVRGKSYGANRSPSPRPPTKMKCLFESPGQQGEVGHIGDRLQKTFKGYY
jgi:hypothetical protein